MAQQQRSPKWSKMMHFVCREIGIENTSKMNINLYKAKLKISREDLRGYLFDNQCTKETVSFFNELLKNNEWEKKKEHSTRQHGSRN